MAISCKDEQYFWTNNNNNKNNDDADDDGADDDDDNNINYNNVKKHDRNICLFLLLSHIFIKYEWLNL